MSDASYDFGLIKVWGKEGVTTADACTQMVGLQLEEVE